MGLFGIGSKSKASDMDMTIEVGKLGKYVNNPKYMEYDFPPVFDEDGILVGYNLKSKKEVERTIHEIKQSKRNPDFDQRIVADGRYKGIDKEVAKKYGDYQNTRGYRKSIRER